MSRSMVLKWFFGSLIGLGGGAVLLVAAGGLALANDVFRMNGPDVVGINSGALAWTLAGLVALALLVMMAAAVAVFVAWIGAVLNTVNLASKTWFILLLVVGMVGMPFVATLAYVVAGPDGTQVEGQGHLSSETLPPGAGSSFATSDRQTVSSSSQSHQ